jgi:hypothetical protein
LHARFETLGAIRQRLVDRHSADLGGFLNWFDRWFLRRAEPVAEAQS